MADYTTSNVEYIGDEGSDGAICGAASTSKRGFFGATPVVQQTGTTLVTTTGIVTGGVFSTSALSVAFVQAVAAIQTALKNLGLTT